MKESSILARMVCSVAAVACTAAFVIAPASSHAAETDDAAYIANLRGVLEHGKRVPSGREASLAQAAGAATVWFDLSSSGAIVDVGVVASSHSQLLDQQARMLVHRARYEPFPANAFADASTHRFVVRYVFNEPRGTVVVGPLQVASR